MTKQESKNIAKVLIAKSGLSFDGYAFGECDLSEKEVQKIMNELQIICQKEIEKIERKYSIYLSGANSYAVIVESILYE